MIHATKKHLILLGLVILIGGLAWFDLNFLGSRFIGGGGSEQTAPDTIIAGKPFKIGLIVSTWGNGGPIRGRYTGIYLNYRSTGQDMYRVIEPKLVTLPSKYVGMSSDTRQWEAYEFTIPPSDLKNATGQIEYFVDMNFDGQRQRIEGIKKIKISSPSESASQKVDYENSALSWAYIYGPENGKVKVYLYASDQTITRNKDAWEFAGLGDEIISGNYDLILDSRTAVDGLDSEWKDAEVHAGELQFNKARPFTDGVLRSFEIDPDGYLDALKLFQYGSSNTDVVYVYRYVASQISPVHFVRKNGNIENFTETGREGDFTQNPDGIFISKWYDNTRGYVRTKWAYVSGENSFKEIETSVSESPL